MENVKESENLINILEGSYIKDLHKTTIIPTIDISKGRAVLVCKGKVVVDNGDPMERAEFLSINSDFQVVDLDRVMEIGENSEIIKKICNKYPCYVAGGIRNFEIASEFLNNNAKRVVIGTALDKRFLNKIPKNRLIVAFDVDEKLKLYKRGRKELSEENIFEKIDEYSEYITFITVTFHYTEGVGEGTDFQKIVIIQNYIKEKGYNIRIAVAGGINSLKQIQDLIKIGITPQFGHGLWKNIFTLGDIYSSMMDYDKIEKYYEFKDKNKPALFPCVILATDGKLLGLTYTDSYGIKESVNSRKCVFYSRERQKRWFKGETSGNFQTILHVGINCDRTALVYVVDGSDFCHLSRKSCFDIRDPTSGNILALENYINHSVKNNDENSYTRKIFENKKLQICKLFEEANEVWTSSSKSNLIHEISDLLYFTILYSVSNGIDIRDICNEIQKRHFKVKKERFLINSIPQDIKLGICLNKHCEKRIFEFLEESGITIIRPEKGNRSLKYEGYLVNHPEKKILPFIIKPKDVHVFLENELIDIVVSFQDILDNYPSNYQKIILDEQKITKISRICVISKNKFDITEFENNPIKKLRIFSEYVLLTIKWLEKRKILAKVFQISGSAEGFLHHDICDVVVCVVDTGRTLLENDLKIVDTIYESEMGIFARMEVADLIQKLLRPDF